MLCNFILYPHIIEGGDSVVLFCTAYVVWIVSILNYRLFEGKCHAFTFDLTLKGFEDIEVLQDKATGMKRASYVICKVVKYFVHF